jgi:hypothetical protein
VALLLDFDGDGQVLSFFPVDGGTKEERIAKVSFHIQQATPVRQIASHPSAWS